MSLMPGIAGQKTELFDGVKVDTLSEYTVGNGVQHQGRTNGVAIESGKVGETLIIKRVASAYNFTSATAFNVADTPSASLTLSTGVWLITGSVFYNIASGQSISSAYAGVSLTSATLPVGNTYSAPNANGEFWAINLCGSLLSAGQTVSIVPYVYTVTSPKTYYLIGNAVVSGSGSSASGFLQAVRIA